MSTGTTVAQQDPQLLGLLEVKDATMGLLKAVDAVLSDAGLAASEMAGGTMMTMGASSLGGAADNMLRILLSGTLKPGMEERFAAQIGAMKDQAMLVQREAMAALPESLAQRLPAALAEVEIPREELLGGARELLKEEGFVLVQSEESLQANPISAVDG